MTCQTNNISQQQGGYNRASPSLDSWRKGNDEIES